MRIIAVIPACEGSSVFPNKNLRVIHGKPMIYYVIKNALNSKYITDVIVTSNSEEVISVARQMGVLCWQREERLADAAVPLDMVVYDVFQEIELCEFDYVVTMQSLAPSLRAESLDCAFEIMRERRFDTMISVVNRRNFYWRIENNRPVPCQEKRTSKYLLPPYYAETGAFLITKAQNVTSSSRIGKNVGLYELSGEEAIDVYSFGDIRQIEYAMCKKETAIFVNGNNRLGLGHIARVLQLADELFTKPDIYFDLTLTNEEAFGKTKHSVHAVNGEQGFIQAVLNKKYDIIINDILSTSMTYMKLLRTASPNSKIVNFEDDGEGAVIADIVINALYQKKEAENVKSGYQYFILPKLFLIYEPIQIKEKVEQVLITFGGADPCGYTDMMLDIMKSRQYRNIHFHVIIGAAKANIEELKSYASQRNVSLYFNINNMPEIMSICDLAVTSRGRTCFELAAMGLPAISIAQNEREEKHDFVCEDNGFITVTKNPGRAVMEKYLMKGIRLMKEERCIMQKKMLRNNLRDGRKNVTALLTE